jgi:hypothetical protein
MKWDYRARSILAPTLEYSRIDLYQKGLERFIPPDPVIKPQNVFHMGARGLYFSSFVKNEIKNEKQCKFPP